MRAFVAIPCGIMLAATTAVAQQIETFPNPPRPKPPPRHMLSVFGGAATVMNNDETGATVSPSYRFRLTRRFAIGPIGNASFYTNRTTYMALLGLYALPKAPVSLYVAPGAEFVHETVGRGPNRTTVEEGPVFRLRVGFQVSVWHFGSIHLSPSLALDYGRTTETLLGVSLARVF